MLGVAKVHGSSLLSLRHFLPVLVVDFQVPECPIMVPFVLRPVESEGSLLGFWKGRGQEEL